MPSIGEDFGRELLEWSRHWVPPVVTALFEYDNEKALSALASARGSLPAAGLGKDQTLAAEIMLEYQDYQRALMILGDPAAGEAHSALLTRLSGLRAAGPVSESFRLCRLLQLRVTGELRGWIARNDSEIRRLLEAIPPERLSAEEQFFIASWAFRRGEVEILRSIVEYFDSIERSFLLRQQRDRARLMLELLEGRPEEKQILDYLEQEMPRTMLADFRRVIMPELERKGLLSTEVMQLFDRRLDDVLRRHHVPEMICTVEYKAKYLAAY